MHPFHLAFPVRNIAETRQFYVEVLGCDLGRADTKWVDFNFYGHQLSAHLAANDSSHVSTNAVDGENVPVRHFGIILDVDSWNDLRKRLESYHVAFMIKPTVRFKGKAGEQHTMFFLDPSGNAIEIKAFKNKSQIFAVD